MEVGFDVRRGYAGGNQMRCKNCGKEGYHFHQHYDGGYVCDGCVTKYFTCPNCGKLFDKDDLEHGDAGTGYCKECSANHI